MNYKKVDRFETDDGGLFEFEYEAQSHCNYVANESLYANTNLNDYLTYSTFASIVSANPKTIAKIMKGIK